MLSVLRTVGLKTTQVSTIGAFTQAMHEGDFDWAMLQSDLIDNRTPLPPMLGRFTAPTLEIEGFTLENVQADIVEPAPASEE